MEHAVTMGLQHFGVNVIAANRESAISTRFTTSNVQMNQPRIAKLGDFLGQKLDTRCGVAKDDGLVDLELR